MLNNKNLLGVACALGLAITLGLASESAFATVAPGQAFSPMGQSWATLTADCDSMDCGRQDGKDTGDDKGSAMLDKGTPDANTADCDTDACGHQDDKKYDGSAMQDRGLANRLLACGDSDYCADNHQDGKSSGQSSGA